MSTNLLVGLFVISSSLQHLLLCSCTVTASTKPTTFKQIILSLHIKHQQMLQALHYTRSLRQIVVDDDDYFSPPYHPLPLLAFYAYLVHCRIYPMFLFTGIHLQFLVKGGNLSQIKLSCPILQQNDSSQDSNLKRLIWSL